MILSKCIGHRVEVYLGVKFVRSKIGIKTRVSFFFVELKFASHERARLWIMMSHVIWRNCPSQINSTPSKSAAESRENYVVANLQQRLPLP